MKGIVLNENNDLMTGSNGSIALGATTIQEVGLLLGLNQGELKSFPVLGPGLTQKIRGLEHRVELKRVVKLHLELDGKRYEDIEELIKIKT